MTDKAKLIQLIHIGKQQLCMDDFTYREFLKGYTNKTSSTKCTVPELMKVVYEMRRCGAKIQFFAKRGAKPTAYSPATGEVKVKSEIAHKIRAVWIQMGKHGFLRDTSEKALNAYMRKVMNKGKTVLALNVGALKGEEASRFLEILKKWHKRVMTQALTERGHKVGIRANYDTVAEYFNEVM